MKKPVFEKPVFDKQKVRGNEVLTKKFDFFAFWLFFSIIFVIFCIFSIFGDLGKVKGHHGGLIWLNVTFPCLNRQKSVFMQKWQKLSNKNSQNAKISKFCVRTAFPRTFCLSKTSFSKTSKKNVFFKSFFFLNPVFLKSFF